MSVDNKFSLLTFLAFCLKTFPNFAASHIFPDSYNIETFKGCYYEAFKAETLVSTSLDNIKRVLIFELKLYCNFEIQFFTTLSLKVLTKQLNDLFALKVLKTNVKSGRVLILTRILKSS